MHWRSTAQQADKGHACEYCTNLRSCTAWHLHHLSLRAVQAAERSTQILFRTQVETVEGLCVRVVSNIRKVGEVKSRFLDAFQDAEKFPSQLPYTQKVCHWTAFSTLLQRLHIGETAWTWPELGICTSLLQLRGCVLHSRLTGLSRCSGLANTHACTACHSLTRRDPCRSSFSSSASTAWTPACTRCTCKSTATIAPSPTASGRTSPTWTGGPSHCSHWLLLQLEQRLRGL